MAEVLKRLTEARGVTGNEDEVREIILELAIKTGAEVSVDRMGNVIAEKSGRTGSKKVMIAAHMDEVGFIISHISDNGMLKFKPVGGIDQRILLSNRSERIHTRRLCKSTTCRSPRNAAHYKIETNVYRHRAHSRKKPEGSRAGDYACFNSSFIPLGTTR